MSNSNDYNPDRTANNAVRHSYRKLSEEEVANIQIVKDDAAATILFLRGLGESRELSIAITKVEEAVMWAVKGITGEQEGVQ